MDIAQWKWSMFFFILLMTYVFYISLNLQRHQEGTWSGRRLLLFMVLPLGLMAYHYGAYGSPTNISSLRDLPKVIFKPLLHWTFLLPLIMAILLISYGQWSTEDVKLGFNIFDGLNSDNLDSFSDSRKLALVNILLVISLALVILFGLTFIVTILQFQRNQLGLFTHLLLYLPCVISDWIAYLVGESKSSIHGLQGQQKSATPRAAIVSGILLVLFSMGMYKMLDTKRTLQHIQQEVNELVGLDLADVFSPDRQESIIIIPSTKDVRLHEPQQISLASSIIAGKLSNASPTEYTNVAKSLSQLKHIWSIRFRLFVNSQQTSSFFQKGTEGELTKMKKTRNVLSFGTYDPLRSDRSSVENYLELRVHEQGLVLRSCFFDNISDTDFQLPASSSAVSNKLTLQSWHDIVVQHTGSKMDMSIDGHLVESINTSTSHAAFSSMISPELTFFHLGERGFNGVISDLAITFNHEITSTNFDHDPLKHRK